LFLQQGFNTYSGSIGALWQHDGPDVFPIINN